MIKKFFILINLLISIVFAYTVGIATGSRNGTYIKIGKDIKKVCSNLNIEVFPTGGSLENIKLLLKDPRIKFGIVQSDVMLFLKVFAPNKIKKLKLVYPLYNEEIHIVVRKDSDINSLRDLKNRRVAIGNENSGTWVTSKVIEAKTGINFDEYEESAKKGLVDLLKGKIDAVILVAGAPVKILKELPSNTPVKLLSFYDSDMDSIYISKIIPSYTYPFQENSVHTYAVKSLLVTYDYSQNSKSYKTIKQLVKCLNFNLNYLKKNGHPKWKEVTNSVKEISWFPIHPAVEEFLTEKKAIENAIKVLQNM